MGEIKMKLVQNSTVVATGLLVVMVIGGTIVIATGNVIPDEALVGFGGLLSFAFGIQLLKEPTKED